MWFTIDQLGLLACFAWVYGYQRRWDARLPFPRPATGFDWWRLASCLMVGALTSSLLQAIRLIASTLPQTLDPGRLWLQSLWVGGVFALAMLGAAFLRSPDDRRGKVSQAVLVAFACGCLQGFVSLRDLNIEADRSESRIIVSGVTAKQDRRGKLFSHRYEVRVSGWDGGKDITLQVRFADYARLEPGRPVRVHVRAGFLRVPWVESVEPGAP